MSKNIARFSFWSAVITTVLTLITFGIAFNTPPLSGPLCLSSCFFYPYTDIASRFPRDYIWIYPAMLLVLSYFVLTTCIHYYAQKDKKIFSHIGLSFALISTTIFVLDYFLQVSVVQQSLLKGEAEGIALLTQFNPHGIFIALEELGFLMMSVAFLFFAPVFSGANKLEKAIRWLFVLNFVLTITSLVIFTVLYGIDREYRFEIATISINWTTLILSGVLLSFLFKRSLFPRLPS